MNQQINLYHPIFRRQEKKFSARAMLQASALLLAGTVIMYAFAWWQVGALRSQITQAERAQQAAVKQLEDISHTLGVKAPDPRLEQDVRELEARVNASQQIEEVLQQDAFARSVGYSNYFAAFARQIVPGLWLTGVTITGAGEQLLLRGRSSHAGTGAALPAKAVGREDPVRGALSGISDHPAGKGQQHQRAVRGVRGENRWRW